MTVLIVGAGPTGLTLAAQLQASGVDFRIVDRQLDRVHESRALAVQPRTLEVLAGLGLADAFVARGNPAVQVQMHTGMHTVHLPLFDIGLVDTAYPFLLFLSQAETEEILGRQLAERGTTVERGVELVRLHQDREGVTCALGHPDGNTETIDADYVVGCDGAHSAVRDLAGIELRGSAYPQTFVLADLGANDLEPGAAHVYLSRSGMLFFFPLVRPAPWRLLAMWPAAEGPWALDNDPAPTLAELQALTDSHTAGDVQLENPVWTTFFRLHHRHAVAYRVGRVFLAGDAAHVHSPAGAQGMNTGIQDAANLGWKLALVTEGTADPELLSTYQAERQPVGRSVLRFTDRAFTIATSTSSFVRTIRTHLAPRLIGLAGRSRRARALGVRSIAQLSITYRRSPAVKEGKPRLRRGPRSGDRLPDAAISLDGMPSTLHQALGAPRHHLLLAGPPAAWPPDGVASVRERYPTAVDIHQLSRQPMAGVLCDSDGSAHGRLGLGSGGRAAHHLVRPDGHIAYRAAGTDLAGLGAYLARWLPGTLSQPGLDRNR